MTPVTSEIPPSTAAHGSQPTSADASARLPVTVEISSAWDETSSHAHLSASQTQSQGLNRPQPSPSGSAQLSGLPPEYPYGSWVSGASGSRVRNCAVCAS